MMVMWSFIPWLEALVKSLFVPETALWLLQPEVQMVW